jgi:hypothetical protein
MVSRTTTCFDLPDRLDRWRPRVPTNRIQDAQTSKPTSVSFRRMRIPVPAFSRRSGTPDRAIARGRRGDRLGLKKLYDCLFKNRLARNARRNSPRFWGLSRIDGARGGEGAIPFSPGRAACRPLTSYGAAGWPVRFVVKLKGTKLCSHEEIGVKSPPPLTQIRSRPAGIREKKGDRRVSERSHGRVAFRVGRALVVART